MRTARLILLLGFVGSCSLALIAGTLTDKGTQPGLTFGLDVGAVCGGCHGDYDFVNDLEPWNTWAGSMMAQASRDPLFWAALDVANHDVPGIGDWCLRCHVPQGWLSGRSEPPGGTVDGCSLSGRIDEPFGDFDGVNCHLCHRMMENPAPPAGEQAFYTENGQFWLDDANCEGQGTPCRRGPYDYAAPDSGLPPHAWTYSPLHEESRLCGTCHNVTHPVKTLIDGGVDTGIAFPIERTFTEWERSSYAQEGTDAATCQNCHMPDTTADPAYACLFQQNNHAGNLGTHHMVGGNAWMPDVLRQEFPALGLSEEFQNTKAAALDMLQNRSATLELGLPAALPENQDLELQVKVTNLTGHKLPTGYPEGRRMWLQVEVRDAQDVLLWESGAYDPLNGVLTHDEQVKIYRVDMGIWNHNGTGSCDIVDGTGTEMFHFAKNDCVLLDNRIPPLGFTGADDIDTRSVGYGYPETSPGSGVTVNHDLTDYVIALPAVLDAPLTVNARLYYQTTSKEYVEFLLDEAVTHEFPNDCLERTGGAPDRTRAQILYDAWDLYDKAPPVEMALASAQLDFAAGGTPGEASAIGDDALLVTDRDAVSGEVTISYTPACATTDHTIYYGNLADVAALTLLGQSCNLGVSGTASFVPRNESSFWLIVGNDGTREGSYGLGQAGNERPEDTLLATCPLPQELAERCDL